MRYVVTGGTGFVGGAIIRRLIRDGHEVISLSRSSCEQTNKPTDEVIVDLGMTSPEHIAEKLLKYKTFDGLFHTAGRVGIGGTYQQFFSANVTATQNVIQLCKNLHIPRLVYTSSPSVIASGRDLTNVDESQPYPTKYYSHYPHTKSLAEKLVGAANTSVFSTVILRPHLIYGPGDRQLVPRILARARAGRLTMVGRYDPVIDITHIDRCVVAHLRAMERAEMLAGKTYFISDGRPVKLWVWINSLLAAENLPPVTKRIPKWLAYIIGLCCEGYVMLCPEHEPMLNRFLLHEFTTDHYFNIQAAERDLFG